MEPDWLIQLRQIHDEALKFDWESHLRTLNARYGFQGELALSTAQAGAPPAWFNGDTEAIEGTSWVLVISLNPQKPPEGYYAGKLTPATAWDFWRTHNTDWWYARFFRPLVRLAAPSIGESMPAHGYPEREFATKRMVFIELCPYASRNFSLSPAILEEFVDDDVGFQIANQVRQLLIDDARPALVLVNGESAVKDFAIFGGEKLQWGRRNYQLKTKSGGLKPIWHYEGIYQTKHGPVPVVGFKFLNKQANHNGHVEIDQLSDAICELVKRGAE
jgi:hypothetical protein